MEWVIILGFLGIFIIAVVLALKKHNSLIESGEIAKRSTKFMEMAEIFTLNTPVNEEVSEKIKQFSCYSKGVGMKGSTVDQHYTFSGYGWDAYLKRISAENSKSVYRFQFTNWKTSNGMPQDALNMNRLLTCIEKMFLSFDPDTQVQNEAVDFSTKRHLF